MKKLLFTVFVLLTTQIASSQITLEKTGIRDLGATMTVTAFTSFKTSNDYMFWTCEDGTLTLYKSDLSVYKRIKLDLNKKSSQYVRYVSSNLFNLDDKIEFVCTGAGLITVYNEDGEILFEKNAILQSDSLGHVNSIYNYGNGTKMLLSSGNVIEEYSLPGNVPLSVTDVSVPKNNYDVKLFPNPVNNNKINIAYTLPDNIKVSKVTIYNTLGQVVKTVKPDKNSTEIDIDTQNLEKGTYFCELMGNKGKISASKFIVQ